MLIRYKTDVNGKPVKQALVYTKKEHGIAQSRVDQDAIKIIRRLEKAGYESYIVGGAVRDLLLGKVPKDFDIVTSAEPNHIRKLFRNSRIIGKRFRLVHIFFHDNKIIEVSTFRSADSKGFSNIFGEIEEDALRRDFSMNALYYNPVTEQVVDFVQGYRDIRNGKLREVIPLNRIFVEDPVRIIRAAKYGVKTGLAAGFFLKRRMKKDAPLLADVSSSRLTEEIYKILGSGLSKSILEEFLRYRISEYILPQLHALIGGNEESQKENRQRLLDNLSTLDDLVAQGGEVARSTMVLYLVRDFVLRLGPWQDQKRINFAEVYAAIKELLKPIIPANKDVEDVVVSLMRERQDGKPRRRKRRRKPAAAGTKPVSKNPPKGPSTT